LIETALLAVGLVLIIEGLVYALAPSILEDLLEAMRSLSTEQRRALGLLAIALGVVFLWVAKTLGA